MENDNFYNPGSIQSTPEPTQKNIESPAQEKILVAYDTLPKKNTSLYVGSFLGILVVAGLYYFFVKKDIITIFVVLLGFIYLVYLGFKKPKELHVSFSEKKAIIDSKEFKFSEYQSFSTRVLARDFVLLSLHPIKRFQPPLNLYINRSEQVDSVTDYLSSILAYKDSSNNFIDTILEWLGI